MKKSKIKEWEMKTNYFLKNMRITKVTFKPHDQWGEGEIDGHGIVLHLNKPFGVKQMKQDIELMIMSDEEGNDVGAIHTNLRDLSVIPSL